MRKVLRGASVAGMLSVLCLHCKPPASPANGRPWRRPICWPTWRCRPAMDRPGSCGRRRCCWCCACLRPRPDWTWPRALASGLALPLALSGHAAMEEGRTGLLHALNDMLHCLAAGFWLGSLPVFLLILRRWTEPACRADATRALMRFSTAGHVAVAVLLLGGVVNAVLILSPEGLDIASAYQQWLGLKVLLALAMTVLAIEPILVGAQDPATAGNRAWAVAPEHCAGSLRGRGDLADRERAWAVSAAMNGCPRDGRVLSIFWTALAQPKPSMQAHVDANRDDQQAGEVGRRCATALNQGARRVTCRTLSAATTPTVTRVMASPIEKHSTSQRVRDARGDSQQDGAGHKQPGGRRALGKQPGKRQHGICQRTLSTAGIHYRRAGRRDRHRANRLPRSLPIFP